MAISNLISAQNNNKISGRIVGFSPLSNTTAILSLLDSTKAVQSFEIPLKLLESFELKTNTIGGAAIAALKNNTAIDQQTLYKLRYNNAVEVTLTIDKSLGLLGLNNRRVVQKIDLTNLVIQDTTSDVETKNKGIAANWELPEETSPFTPVQCDLTGAEIGQGHWRIGYAKIPIPIYTLSKQSVSKIDQQASLRGSGTIKKGLGVTYDSYTLMYRCHGVEQIQKGVQEVYEQIGLTPFLPVEGGPFGFEGENSIATNAIAVKSFTINTVDDLPNVVEVILQFEPFVWEFYLPYTTGTYPRTTFSKAFCMPLFKLWCKSRGKSTYNGAPFSGHVGFLLPDPELTETINSIFDTPERSADVNEDIAALTTLRNGILGGSSTNIISPNAKEIRFTVPKGTASAKLLALKLANSSVFYSFLNKGGNPLSFSTLEDSIVGLIDWNSKLSKNNYTDGNGFAPTSANVNIDRFTPTSQTGPLKPISVGDVNLNILDFSTRDGSLLAQLQTAKATALSTLTPNTPEYIAADRDWSGRIERPWAYYAIAILSNTHTSADLKNKLDKTIETYKGDVEFTYSSYRDRLSTVFTPDVSSIYINCSDISNEILVERISATKNYNLAGISHHGQTRPIHSHVGSLDTVVAMEGTCFSEAAVNMLQALKEEFQVRALHKVSRKFAVNGTDSNIEKELGLSILKVENEICALIGSEFLMPLTLDFEPIQKQPGCFRFSMSFIDYDPKTLTIERIKYLETTIGQLSQVYTYGWNTTGNNPILQKAEDFLSLQFNLSREELLPDMVLPTQAEVNYWIGKIIEFSSVYVDVSKRTNINGPRTALRYLNQANYTAADWMLVNNIADFLETDAENMAKWADRQRSAINRNVEPGLFAETDFYIYYEKKDDFSNVLASIAEDMLGKRKSDLSSDGPTIRANPAHAHFRFKDEVHNNVTAVANADYPALVASKIPGDINYLQSNIYPKTRAAEVQSIIDSASTSMDAQAIGNWWQTVGEVYTVATGDTLTVTAEQENSYLFGFIQDNSKSWVTPEQRVERVEAEGTAVDALDSLQYRQTKAKEAASYGQSKAMPYTFQGSTSDMLSDKLARTFFPSMHTQNLKDKSKEFLDDIVKKNYETVFIPGSNLAGIYGEDVEANIRDRSFIAKTALANSAYSFNKTNTPSISTVWGSGNPYKNLQDIYNFVLNQSARSEYKGKIDPNVILGFLLKRDQFGAFKPNLSIDDVGFGDVSKHWLETHNLAPNDVNGIITYLIKDYATGMDKYANVPTLALTHLHILTNSKARESAFVDGQLRPDIQSYMHKVANQVSGNRLGPRSFKELQEFANAQLLGKNGTFLDEYFKGYIHITRYMGAILPSNIWERYTDSFFFPLHGLIISDFETNNGKTVSTKFTPTGAVGKIPLTRNELVYKNPALTDSYDLNNTSLENQINENQRLGYINEPHSEAAVYGSLVDLNNHSAFGKLRGAFPTYQVLLINEGFYWGFGVNKLWDQYYTRLGVSDIEVFRSRLDNGGKCNITFSNMFYQLSAYFQMEVLQQQLTVEANDRFGNFVKRPWTEFSVLWDVMTRKLPSEAKKIWKQNHLKALALNVGTRLHVRMGYTSNAAKLPIVFNGTVSSAPVSDGYMEIEAVSDGVELDKAVTTKLVSAGDSYAYSTRTKTGIGQDPSNIISQAAIAGSLADAITQGIFRDKSQGLTHFGDPVYDGILYTVPELQTNIYSSNPTKLEQQIPMIQDYFNVNALYNWSGVNLFSVEVHDPTVGKVMETCRRACLDYVGSAEWFDLRSTLFFGKWWWPYNYSYDAAVLDLTNNFGDNYLSVDLPKEQSVKMRNLFGDLFDWVTKSKYKAPPDEVTLEDSGKLNAKVFANDLNYLRQFFKWKTYMQAYFAYSHINLLSNHITPSSELVYTDAYGIHKYNGVISPTSTTKTLTYSVDTDITPQDRRAIAVDTGLVVTTTQAGWRAAQEAILTPLQFVPVLNSVRDHVRSAPTTPAISNSIVSALTDSVKEMYQGSFLMFGQPTMKPHDLVLLNDHKLDMRGPVFVKEVMHKLNAATGLVTIVSPDCVVYPHSSQLGHQLVTSLAGGVLPRVAGYYMLKTFSSLTFGSLKEYQKNNGFVKLANNLRNYNETLPKIKVDLDVVADNVRARYTDLFQRQLKDIDAKLAAVKPDSTKEYVNNLVKDRTKILDKQQEIAKLSSFEELEAFGVKNGLGPASVSDFSKAAGYGSTTNNDSIAKVFLKEREIEANRLHNIEEAKRLGFKDAEAIALRAANQERAAFYAANPDLFIGGAPDNLGVNLELERRNLTEIQAKIKNQHVSLTAAQEKNSKELATIFERLESEVTKPKQLRSQVEINRIHKRIQLLQEDHKNITEQFTKGIQTLETDVVTSKKKIAGLLNDIKIAQSERDIVYRWASVGWTKASRAGYFKKVPGVGLVPLTPEELLDLERIVKLNGYETKTFPGLSRVFGEVGGGLLGAEEIVSDSAIALRAALNDPERLSRLNSSTKAFVAQTKEVRAMLKEISALNVDPLKVRASVGVAKVTQMLKDAKIAANLAQYGGPQAILAIAKDIVWATLFEGVFAGITAKLAARQCVKIVPLTVKGKPFVAGIRGHQGAVIGDDPSWADQLLHNWLSIDIDNPDNIGESIGRNWIGIAAMLVGVEEPAYLQDAFDSELDNE